MRTMMWIGAVMLVVGLALLGSGIFKLMSPVPAFVLGGNATLLGGVLFFIGRGISRSNEQSAREVAELTTRGIRRKGTVRDVVPYASPHGGAVIRPEGAQLVVQIELDDGSQVTCHLVENTETARARIGTSIVVIEHPEARGMRAIEGYLPNGRRA